jgi:uncharacterized RDD family membrane protein YckC
VSQSDEFLSIDTPENVIFAYEVVGIGSRFMAGLIDTLILAGLLLLVDSGLVLLLDRLFAAAQSWVAALAGLLSFAIFWGYYLFFELTWNGQSPGKRRIGIRVIRRDGTPITLVESLVRNLVRVVDFLPAGYGVGIITMFIHPQSCRLGDLAAGTLVVREQEEVTLASLHSVPRPAPVTTDLPTDQAASPWPVERLTPADVQLATDFLQRRAGLANAEVLALAIAQRLLGRMGLAEQAPQPGAASVLVDEIVKAYRAR